MAQCVMTSGTMTMPRWCADNWDSLLMVISIILGFSSVSIKFCASINIQVLLPSVEVDSVRLQCPY